MMYVCRVRKVRRRLPYDVRRAQEFNLHTFFGDKIRVRTIDKQRELIVALHTVSRKRFGFYRLTTHVFDRFRRRPDDISVLVNAEIAAYRYRVYKQF